MRRTQAPSHKMSGHTDTATINQRKPMTARMRAFLISIRDDGSDARELRNMTTGEKNTIRALVDRGYAEYDGTKTGKISRYVFITQAGREALKK